MHDLPGVGANLQDHLQIRAVFKVHGEQRWGLSLNTMAHTLWGKARIGLEYALRRTGPMSMAPSQLGAFTRSSPGQPHPNIQFHVQPLTLDAFGQPLHAFTHSPRACATSTRPAAARVRISSARLEDAPAIAPNYLARTRTARSPPIRCA